MRNKKDFSKANPKIKTSDFFSVLKKAVTSRPAPLKPAKAKRQTSTD